MKSKETELELMIRKVKDILTITTYNQQQQQQSSSSSALSKQKQSSSNQSDSEDGLSNDDYISASRDEKEKMLDNIQSLMKDERIDAEKIVSQQAMMKYNAIPLVSGEPIEEGTFLIVLEPGILLGI